MASSKLLTPTGIPQEIQTEILALAVLKARLDSVSAAYQRKQEQVAEMLTASVEVR